MVCLLRIQAIAPLARKNLNRTIYQNYNLLFLSNVIIFGTIFRVDR